MYMAARFCLIRMEHLYHWHIWRIYKKHVHARLCLFVRYTELVQGNTMSNVFVQIR